MDSGEEAVARLSIERSQRALAAQLAALAAQLTALMTGSPDELLEVVQALAETAATVEVEVGPVAVQLSEDLKAMQYRLTAQRLLAMSLLTTTLEYLRHCERLTAATHSYDAQGQSPACLRPAGAFQGFA